MCGQKPRLETSQRAKYLTQVSGCEGLWSCVVLVWVRGSQGNSGRKGPQQVVAVGQPPAQSRIGPFAICLSLSLVLLLHSWPWGADCLTADAARSLQRRIPVGAAAFFSGQWELVLGCWGTCRAGGKGCLQQLPRVLCHEQDVKLLRETPAVFNTEGHTVFKMENTILLNILNMAQSSVLIDSVWMYIYWHTLCCMFVETLFL